MFKLIIVEDEHLIDEPVLNINSARVHPGEVALEDALDDVEW